MKNQRLDVFRSAVEGLIESLDALVRVSRWTDTEAPPEPIRTARAKLVDRLGTAERLSSGHFVGKPADENLVTAMCATMKKLDAAYMTFRRRVDQAPDRAAEAAATLESDLGAATADAAGWRGEHHSTPA
jgi:hypothetical protein